MRPQRAPIRPAIDMDRFASGIRAGERAVLARAITLIESKRPDHQHQARQLVQDLLPDTGKAMRVGITGAPGVGKSTTVDALGTYLTEHGHGVAVLAVDPSSARTGGSILGDKTRMARLAVVDAGAHDAVRRGPLGARPFLVPRMRPAGRPRARAARVRGGAPSARAGTRDRRPCAGVGVGSAGTAGTGGRRAEGNDGQTEGIVARRRSFAGFWPRSAARA